MARLFLSQQRLDDLVAEDRVVLEGERLEVPLVGTFRLVPAVHVTSVIDGAGRDELVGRVRSEAALRSAGAEVMLTSLIVGDTGYECVPGYLGEPDGLLDADWTTRVRDLTR